MKIWLQSGSALAGDAATPYGRMYEEALERHFAKVARPGTELASFGIDGTPFGKDRYHTAFQKVVSLMIKSAVRAEEQGFDAVAVLNTFDHGYYELREVIDLPVVFISESSMLLACQLAPSFGCVTHNRALLEHMALLAKRYGLARRMIRGHSLDLTYDDFPRMYDDPEPYLEAFRAAARPVIERGATMLLVAGNPVNMFLLEHDLREVDGVPVLDGCAAVVKTAEMMVDLDRLGIERSTQGLFAAPPPDDVARLRKIHE